MIRVSVRARGLGLGVGPYGCAHRPERTVKIILIQKILNFKKIFE